MSIFSLTCNNCGHKFYDIVVLCTNEKVEDKCPICNSKDIKQKTMPKPKDKLWAEDNKSSCNNCKSKCKTEESVFKMPESLVKELKKPWGEILKKIPEIDYKKETIITIGDISSWKFLDKDIIPNLVIIDNKVQRENYEKSKNVDLKLFDKTYKIKNPQSCITKKLYSTIEKLDFSKSNLIEIDGEEDLATLVCLLHSPINSNLFYGQVNKGLVHIKLDKKIKYKAEDLFNKFE